MGNQKSNTAPPKGGAKKVAEPTEQEKTIKIEKTMNALDRQIKAFEDKQKKADVQIDGLKAKAKQLLEAGKKNDAKKYLQTATRLKKQTENVALRRKAVENKKFQLEQALMDKEAVNALSEAQENLKDQQKYAQQLEDIILDTKQNKMLQDEMNNKLKDLVDDDELEDDVDDMLAELQGEVNQAKKEKIGQKNPNANVNVGAQKQKQKQTEDDEVAKMLAEL